MKCISALVFAFLAVIAATPARAEVTQVEISSLSDLLGGHSYGAVGPYEWLEGRAHFALDPAHPANRAVVDIGLAPRNSRGLVEFSADIAVLRPKDPARASGVTIFDVVNRGRPTILEYLNRGDRLAKPGTAEYIGDDFLLKQGTTVIWLGWQHDLPAGQGMLRIAAPVVAGIEGLINGDEVVAAKTADISLGDRTSIPCPASVPDSAENTLSVADSRTAPPRIIPRSEWSFARMQNGELVADPKRIYLKTWLPAWLLLPVRVSHARSLRCRGGTGRDTRSHVVGPPRLGSHRPREADLCLRHFAERALPASVRERGIQRRPRRPSGV